MSRNSVNGQIPIDVCFAGHRNLLPEQVPEIEVEVRRFFCDLSNAYPHTPLRCYTALAIGADQLVAKIALEMNLQLIAVLPAPKQVYLEHFFEDGTSGNFEALHRQASRTVTLPLPCDVTMADVVGPANRNNRSHQFASLGNFISDRALILLALYDGKDNKRKGGTAWIAERKREGRHQEGAERLNRPERGLVYHINVGRLSDRNAEIVVRSGFVVHADETIEDYKEAFGELEHFNMRVARVVALSGNTEAKPHAVRGLENAFSAADELARAEKSELQRARTLLFACAVIMFFTYIVYSNVESLHPIVLLYVAAQVAGALAWKKLQSRKTFRRYLNYRCFAEAVRVQIAWQKCGLQAQVVDFVLRKHRAGLRWTNLALRSLTGDEHLAATTAWTDAPSEPDLAEQIPATLWSEWIEPARDHFSQSERNHKKYASCARTTAVALYALGIGCGFGSMLRFFDPSIVSSSVEQILVVAMGAVPAFAALLLGFSDKQGWERDAVYSKHMHDVFSQCSDLWAIVSQRDLVSEVGKESLRNNGDWLSAHGAIGFAPPPL